VSAQLALTGNRMNNTSATAASQFPITALNNISLKISGSKTGLSSTCHSRKSCSYWQTATAGMMQPQCAHKCIYCHATGALLLARLFSAPGTCTPRQLCDVCFAGATHPSLQKAWTLSINHRVIQRKVHEPPRHVNLMCQTHVPT